VAAAAPEASAFSAAPEAPAFSAAPEAPASPSASSSSSAAAASAARRRGSAQQLAEVSELLRSAEISLGAGRAPGGGLPASPLAAPPAPAAGGGGGAAAAASPRAAGAARAGSGFAGVVQAAALHSALGALRESLPAAAPQAAGAAGKQQKGGAGAGAGAGAPLPPPQQTAAEEGGAPTPRAAPRTALPQLAGGGAPGVGLQRMVLADEDEEGAEPAAVQASPDKA